MKKIYTLALSLGFLALSNQSAFAKARPFFTNPEVEKSFQENKVALFNSVNLVPGKVNSRNMKEFRKVLNKATDVKSLEKYEEDKIKPVLEATRNNILKNILSKTKKSFATRFNVEVNDDFINAINTYMATIPFKNKDSQ